LEKTFRLLTILEIVVAECLEFDAFFMTLQFLAWFESDGLAGGNCDLFASPWVSSYSALSGFYDEHAKASQFDSFPTRKRLFHRMKQGIYGLFGLHFRDASSVGDTVNYVEFNHANGLRRVEEGLRERRSKRKSFNC
jgi:hypothetical protein